MVPTIAAIVGSELIADRNVDGKDITSLLLEPEPKSVRDTYLYYNGRGGWEAIRISDWKLGLRTSKGIRLMPCQLFNLCTEIGETIDAAAENPDVVERLLETATEMGTEIKNNSRPAAKVR